MSYLFQQALKNNANAPSVSSTAGQKDAIDWFRKQALSVTRVNTNRMIDDVEPFKRLQSLSVNSIGKMYMFFYDPKLKQQLPYYDRFPLVFPIEFYDDSFLGINLHYLPPMLRARLMDSLYSTINNFKFNKTTKLQITYKTLKGAARFKLFQPCIKKYLFSHVKSPFIYVSPDEWDFALMLPSDRFVKAGKNAVWEDSRRMV